MRYTIIAILIFAAFIIGCNDDTQTPTIIDADGNIIWVINQRDDTMLALDDAGTPYFTVSDFDRPEAIDCYAADGSIWIIDFYGNFAAKYTISGNQVFSTGDILRQPTGLDIDQTNGSVWIADNFVGKVTKLSSDGSTLANITGLSFPRKVSVVPDTGDCWIADNNVVVKIPSNTSGTVAYPSAATTIVTAIDTPRDIAGVNGGGAWCVDKENAILYGIDKNGNIIATFTGFTDPSAVYVNSQLNSVFVVDNGANSVVKFPANVTGNGAYTDSSTLEIIGLNSPVKVWVDDASGKIYVVNQSANSIEIYAADGTSLSSITGMEQPVDVCYWVNPAAQ